MIWTQTTVCLSILCLVCSVSTLSAADLKEARSWLLEQGGTIAIDSTSQAACVSLRYSWITDGDLARLITIRSVSSNRSYDWWNVKLIVEEPLGTVRAGTGTMVRLGPGLVPLKSGLPRLALSSIRLLSSPVW